MILKRIFKNKRILYLVTLVITFSFAFSGIIVYNSLNPSSPKVIDQGTLLYMSVDGISFQPDEAIAPGDSIKIKTILFAGLNLGVSASGLRGERLQISDVVVEKYVDNIMTPQLWDDFFRSVRINTVHLYVFSPMGDGSVYITSIVDSYSDTSLEQISFKFSTIIMTFQNTGHEVTYNYGR